MSGKKKTVKLIDRKGGKENIKRVKMGEKGKL